MTSKLLSQTIKHVCKLIRDKEKKAMMTLACSTDGDTFMLPAAEDVSQQMRQSADTVMPKLDTVKPFSDIPGPRGVPLLGNVLKYSKLGLYLSVLSTLLMNYFISPLKSLNCCD